MLSCVGKKKKTKRNRRPLKLKCSYIIYARTSHNHHLKEEKIIVNVKRTYLIVSNYYN